VNFFLHGLRRLGRRRANHSEEPTARCQRVQRADVGVEVRAACPEWRSTSDRESTRWVATDRIPCQLQRDDALVGLSRMEQDRRCEVRQSQIVLDGEDLADVFFDQALAGQVALPSSP
jgi:hypothetical protein